MEYNDERAMFPRHLRNYLEKDYQERLIIANRRYLQVKTRANGEDKSTIPYKKGKIEKCDQELIDFFAMLEKNQVVYILIGGFAVNLHGFSRFTANIDIWIEDTVQNWDILNKTLIACGMNETFHRLNNGLPITKAVRLTGLENLTVEACLKTALIAMVGNIAVPVLPIGQLIINKKALDRQIDGLDVLALKEIQKILTTHFQGKV
jgi:hypothetical protein